MKRADVGAAIDRALAGCSLFEHHRTLNDDTSMSVAMKQRYACAGVLTIGSPRMLKLVLMMTAHPVMRSNVFTS
jgi:hypothetical protein